MPVAIESDVDILAADCEHGLVGVEESAVGYDNRPALTEVDRLGHDHVQLLTLQPGRIDGAAVGGIDDDLRIVLASPWRRDLAGRLPGRAIVVADYENHGRERTRAASRNAPVLWIKNVSVAKSIGCDGGLPLIAHGEADPSLRGESCFRGKCGGNDRADEQDRESKPGTSVGAVDSQGHKTSGELGAKPLMQFIAESRGPSTAEWTLR